MGANVMHLTADKTTGRLIYRRAVPPSLRPYFIGQVREFKRSLGTDDLGAPGAAVRFAAALAEYDREVALARKDASGAFDALDTRTMTFLADQHRVATLDADSASRYDPQHSPSTRREMAERNENNWEGYGTVLRTLPSRSRGSLTSPYGLLAPKDCASTKMHRSSINYAACCLRPTSAPWAPSSRETRVGLLQHLSCPQRRFRWRRQRHPIYKHP